MVLVVAAIAGATPTTTTAQVPVLAEGQPLGAGARLSDETTLSRYAYARAATPIHKTPGRFGKTVGRLRYQTEDGYFEPYLLLQTILDGKGRRWVQLRVPGRPNGRTGWVPRSSLERFHVVLERLVVDRRALRATLYRAGRSIWSARIGVGAPATPTPAGRFIVRERFRISQPGSGYGPYAFGTSDYSVLSEWPRGGVVGIHGTNAPGLIPGRPSHGCVRLRNSAILRLARLMPIGTPVQIV